MTPTKTRNALWIEQAIYYTFDRVHRCVYGLAINCIYGRTDDGHPRDVTTVALLFSSTKQN